MVFDYSADDSEHSGGISNANKSLIKHNSDNIQVWNKQELESNSDSVELTVQFRIITEYVPPNFENIYPEDITKYIAPISWKANFGESYFVTITGDKISGYRVVYTPQSQTSEYVHSMTAIFIRNITDLRCDLKTEKMWYK